MPRSLWILLLIGIIFTWILLFGGFVGCAKPGPFFQPFTCDLGFKEVHYTIRSALSDCEVVATDENHGFQDVVYKGAQFVCADLVNYVLPVTCRTLGGVAVPDEETLDLDEV